MSYKLEEELTELAKNIETVITDSLDSLELNKAKAQVNSAMDHAIDEVRRALGQAGTKLNQAGEKLDQTLGQAAGRSRQKDGESGAKQSWTGKGRMGRMARRIPDISRMTPSPGPASRLANR